jgi:hypothetical protein
MCAATAEFLGEQLELADRLRAGRYDGSHHNPPDIAMTPEEWVAEEKLMPGALHGYRYVEDGSP